MFFDFIGWCKSKTHMSYTSRLASGEFVFQAGAARGLNRTLIPPSQHQNNTVVINRFEIKVNGC